MNWLWTGGGALRRPNLAGKEQLMARCKRTGSGVAHWICIAALLVSAAVCLQAGTVQAQQASAGATPANGGEAILRGDFAKSVDTLTQELDAPGLGNDQRAGLLNDRGVSQWRLGQLKPALDDFNKAAILYPELASIYNNRGNVLMAIQAPAEALRDFDRAILLAPAYAAAFNNRAIARIQLKDSDGAIADFSKAAELAPNASAPINGRGRIHLDLGRPYLALRDFSRSIALDPGYRPGYRNRALARMALRQFGVAIDDLNNALTFAPNDAGLLLTRGTAQIGLQSYPAALQDLDRLVTLTPQSPAAYAERGHVRALMGIIPEAMADFAKAIELDPKNREAYVYRAEAHLLSNETGLGIADAERALKIDQRFGMIYRVRGRLKESLDQKDEAIADYKQAVSLDSGDLDAWSGLQRLTGKDRPPAELVVLSQVPGWSLVREGDKMSARSDPPSEMLVPLEGFGADPPVVLNWEPKLPPFKGIGVLRYIAGTFATPAGAQEVELAAIIDVPRRQIIGVELFRQGDKLATWTWMDTGLLVVKGPDGVSSNYHLADGVAVAGAVPARPTAPIYQSTTTQPRRQTASASSTPPPRRKKGFSLFDLLFN